mmetsp:Transcript_2780/g.7069  ORF Transcript_2780/g.7069 Transcript_2780/m.7069 type:complete len:92 (-) Transcript_2780:1120-1395(-)
MLRRRPERRINLMQLSQHVWLTKHEAVAPPTPTTPAHPRHPSQVATPKTSGSINKSTSTSPGQSSTPPTTNRSQSFQAGFKSFLDKLKPGK